jgi:hypothetical protein
VLGYFSSTHNGGKAKPTAKEIEARTKMGGVVRDERPNGALNERGERLALARKAAGNCWALRTIVTTFEIIRRPHGVGQTVRVTAQDWPD